MIQLKWLTMEDDHKLPSGPSPSERQIVVHTALDDKVPVDFSGLLLTRVLFPTLVSSQAYLLAVYRLFRVVLLRN